MIDTTIIQRMKCEMPNCENRPHVHAYGRWVCLHCLQKLQETAKRNTDKWISEEFGDG